MLIFTRVMIFIFLFSALHLHYCTKDKMPTDRIIGIALWIAIVHNLTVFFVCSVLLNTDHYIYYAAPFHLFFGPLLYFYFLVSVGDKLLRRSLFLHGLPILAGWIAYLIFVSNPEIREQSAKLYYPVLYSCTGVSLVAYSICIFSKKLQTVNIAKIVYFSWYCLLLGLFTLFVVSRMVIHSDRHHQLTLESNYIVTALLMLFGVLILFTETYQRFSRGATFENKPVRSKLSVRAKQCPRELSLPGTAIQAAAVAEFQKLDLFFSSDAIQDVDLDLQTAASRLHITRKTLSGLILAKEGTTFAKLLTRKRIEEACRILLSPEFDDSYEKLPRVCGFKSTASFYRNFSALLHCSPTEFRNWYYKLDNHAYLVNME